MKINRHYLMTIKSSVSKLKKKKKLGLISIRVWIQLILKKNIKLIF